MAIVCLESCLRDADDAGGKVIFCSLVVTKNKLEANYLPSLSSPSFSSAVTKQTFEADYITFFFLVVSRTKLEADKNFVITIPVSLASGPLTLFVSDIFCVGKMFPSPTHGIYTLF